MCDYLVTIETDEPDTLTRVDILTSTFFRLLRESKLKRVRKADYRAGTIVLELQGPPDNPSIATGAVKISIETLE